MKITVYHSTSSIFLQSIKDRGLVAVDIRRELPLLCSAMNDIMDILDHNYANMGDDWGESSGFRRNCRLMADNNYKNQSTMDFEYGGLYVTPSKIRIASYGANEFGSELLTHFFLLYRCLFLIHGDESKETFDNKYPELVKIIGVENKRNLIFKAEVDLSDLLNDCTGASLKKDDIEYIQFMQEAFDGEVQRSFRMARTLMPEEIELLIMEGKSLRSLGKLMDFQIPDEWEQITIGD